MNDELYTIEVCAKKADVSMSTIKRDIAQGLLTPTRIRGAVRIAPRDWEEYLQKCRSVNTAPDGKFEFSMPEFELAKRLRLTGMLKSTNDDTGSGSQIIELAERRNTRSKRRS